MKKIVICMALCLALGQTFAQTKEVKALHIGDQMPEHTFANIINYPKAKASLIDFKGKYIILDFWGRGCSTCIAAFPHMQELQLQFNKNIQVILVNSDMDNRQIIEDVLNRLKKRTGTDIKLPAVFQDSMFSSKGYFPHRSVPHEVIISPEGKVFAITGHLQLTSKNIAAMIERKVNSFDLKDDFMDINVPMVNDPSTKTDTTVLVYSALMGHVPYYRQSTKFNNKGEIVGSITTNLKLASFYQRAYKQNNSKIIIESQDPLLNNSGYSDPSSDVSYDYIVKGSHFTDELYLKSLRMDLQKAFDFIVKDEIRNLPCLIIKTNAGIAKSESKYKASEREWNFTDMRATGTPLYAHYQDIHFLGFLGLEKLFNVQHIVYDTDYSKMVDVDFPIDFDFNNPALMKSFLHERGIDLSVENREVKCFVISDGPKAD